jgi:Papain-like cysteine protease AvrRpt2
VSDTQSQKDIPMNKSSWLNIALFTCSLYGFSSRWVLAQDGFSDTATLNAPNFSESLSLQNPHRWATIATMTISLSNQALSDKTIATDRSLGMIEEVSRSHTIAALATLLDHHGSLWIASDEPRLRTRIITGILGDGTPNGTQLQIVEPGERYIYTQSFSQFAKQYEDVAYKEITVGDELRLQIKHANRSLLKHSISITLLSRMQDSYN